MSTLRAQSSLSIVVTLTVLFARHLSAQPSVDYCIAEWGPLLQFGLYDTDITTQSSEYHRRFAHLVESEEGQDHGWAASYAAKVSIPLDDILTQNEGSAGANSYSSFRRKGEDYVTEAIDSYFLQHTDQRHVNTSAMQVIADACTRKEGVYASWTTSGPSVPNFRVRVHYVPEHNGTVTVGVATHRGARCSSRPVHVDNNNRTGIIDCTRDGSGPVYVGLRTSGAPVDWIGKDEVELPALASGRACSMSSLAPEIEDGSTPLRVTASEDDYQNVTVCATVVDNATHGRRTPLTQGYVTLVGAITGSGSGASLQCWITTHDNSCPPVPLRVEDRYLVQVRINNHFVGERRWSKNEMIGRGGYAAHTLPIPDSLLRYVHLNQPNIISLGIRNEGTRPHIPPDEDPLQKPTDEMAMYFTLAGILVSR